MSEGALAPGEFHTADLEAPPDRTPPPAVVSAQPHLPFGELSWENFERLCYRLVGGAAGVEAVRRYGRQGQNQQGIDLFVRFEDGAYETWQVKRYARFRASDLQRALEVFRAGSWKDRSRGLVIAVQAPIDDVVLQEAVETATAAFKAEGLSLDVLGRDELSERLREAPRIVHDFFGRPWTAAFFGEAVDPTLLSSLDGAEFAKVRTQLRDVYEAQFSILDQGIMAPLVLSDPTPGDRFTLLKRYTHPDVLRRDVTTEMEPTPASEAVGHGAEQARLQRTVERARRVPLEAWAAEGEHLALVADAGFGKSTFLRALALDLLADQAVFPRLAQRWANRLPLVIPFARWARATAAAGGHVSLRDIVHATWQPLVTRDLTGFVDRAIEEGRILLLVDGLDEWTDEQAARTTLSTVLTLADAHKIPTIVTGRPRGLQKIGALAPEWRVGDLASLSAAQQRVLAGRWFAQSLASGGGAAPTAAVRVEVDRFFMGLRQEPGLLALSETPLLLLGLVGLALRNHVLPRTRVQALERLVATLIEEHPQRRATAAGDPAPRFDVLDDPDVRRGALGALALASREEGADAGLDPNAAKRIVAQYLRDEEGFTQERARQGATELLAVNAETVGLVIEKAPGEVGFAHASLEEFLAAQALLRRSLADVLSFMATRCGSPRWRNVFADLASQVVRPNELEEIVRTLEAADLDPVSAASRDLLLATIAFTAPHLRLTTAERLADKVYDVVEGGGWMGQRRRLLPLVQKGLSRTALAPAVEARQQAWGPRRSRYASWYFDALAELPPADDIFETLVRGLSHETARDRVAAARALARTYAAWPSFQPKVGAQISGANSLDVVGAALLALVLANPRHEATVTSAEGAVDIEAPLLQIIGRYARVLRDAHSLEDRTALLELSNRRSIWLDAGEDLIHDALWVGWPNDPNMIELALKAVRDRAEDMSRDTAVRYLIRCAPGPAALKAWILEEADKEYPFNFGGGDYWAWLVPFAQADAEIADKLVRRLLAEEGGLYDHYAWPLVAGLRDPRLRDHAIARVRTSKWMDGYWNLKPILAGWRGDPAAEALIQEIPTWPDERISELMSLLPQVIPDREACRARLLGMQPPERGRLRYDFMAQGLVALGCDHNDEAAVRVLLDAAESSQGVYTPRDELIVGFSAHPAVRTFALAELEKPDPPIRPLIQRFAEDPDFRPGILRYGAALPTTLRYPLVESARTDGDRRTASARMLQGYALEEDTDLKVILAIGHYETVAAAKGPKDDFVQRLVADAQQGGADHESRRAAALAGLITLDAADRLRDVVEGGKPLALSVGGYGHESPTLTQLIADRWAELDRTFDGKAVERIGRYNQSALPVWEALAPQTAANSAASGALVAFCESTRGPLGAATLRALARSRPRSSLVEEHCWRVLESDGHADLDRVQARLEAIDILRGQFPGRADITARLTAGSRSFGLPDARWIGLALYAPDSDPIRNFGLADEALQKPGLDWPTVIHIAAEAGATERFVELTRRMIHRDRRSSWDVQARMNEVVIARLRRDADAVAALSADLMGERPTTTALATLPRYLTAVGGLDREAHARCLDVLQKEMSSTTLPHVGFDAVADQLRSISHSLLDALAEPAGL